MSAQQKSGAALSELVHLADDLASALARGDTRGAREAHDAIGRELEGVTVRPAEVVDLAQRRRRRLPLRAVREAVARTQPNKSSDPDGGGA